MHFIDLRTTFFSFSQFSISVGLKIVVATNFRRTSRALANTRTLASSRKLANSRISTMSVNVCVKFNSACLWNQLDRVLLASPANNAHSIRINRPTSFRKKNVRLRQWWLMTMSKQNLGSGKAYLRPKKCVCTHWVFFSFIFLHTECARAHSIFEIFT